MPGIIFRMALNPLTFRWSPWGQDLGIGVMCQTESHFNFSLLLWWKLFFSTLYSLLKRFVLSMCKQTVLEFQACQCSHNAWQCRIVCPSVWKTIFPSWFDQKQSSSTELPGWDFTQGEVSLYFFPACFS